MDRLFAARGAGLGDHLRDVPLGSVEGDSKLISDLGVRESLRHEARHLLFARRELIKNVGLCVHAPRVGRSPKRRPTLWQTLHCVVD